MSWYQRLKYAVTIEPFDYENTMSEDVDYDLNQRADQAEMVFQKSKIHYDSRNFISHVAVENGEVIGAVASGWNIMNFGSQDVWVYTFDVAVDPSHRNKMAGIKLISEAINDYERNKVERQESRGIPTMMRLWVINKKLVPILVAKFGFEIESEYPDGSAHLIRY